jgi:DNA polymerase III delta prime subunit
MSKLWVFEHEPKTLSEMIVSEEKRKILSNIINDLPNTLIAGLPGTGKGTFMNILKRTADIDWLKINGSDETGVDMVRDKIKSFAKSFSSKTKVVYINESDRLSNNAMSSLLQIQEDVQSITRFFFVCNNPSKIIDPILSRCSYKLNLNDPPAKEIYKFVINILKKEKIKVEDKQFIIDVIKKLYPDIRQIIGTLQSNVNDGVIDKISYGFTTDLYKTIFDKFIAQDIEGVRKILKSNYIDYPELFNYTYKEIMENGDNIKKPAELIIKTGEFLYKDNFVNIKEINFMTYMLTCMKEGIT